MQFTELEIKGCFLIKLSPFKDDRGYLARTFCKREFRDAGIDIDFVQCSTVLNRHRLTLRGMHYVSKESKESKLIRCTRGKVFDVIVDLREESSSFGQWIGIELAWDNGKMLYVPPRIAHGYISLEDDSELFYQMGDFYVPEHARGLRWNDPTISIKWPAKPVILSDKDASLPYLKEIRDAPSKR